MQGVVYTLQYLLPSTLRPRQPNWSAWHHIMSYMAPRPNELTPLIYIVQILTPWHQIIGGII